MLKFLNYVENFQFGNDIFSSYNLFGFGKVSTNESAKVRYCNVKSSDIFQTFVTCRLHVCYECILRHDAFGYG